ncbi:TPA: glycosyltransferase family 4 protein [Serratia fonticola]
MKILFLTNEYSPFNGGISRYCQMLVKNKAENVELEIIAPGYEKGTNETGDGYKLMRYKGGKFKWSEFPRLLNVVNGINPDDYDRIHVADWPFWLAICFHNLFFLWKNKIKFTTTIYGSEVLNFKNGSISPFVKLLSPFKYVTGTYPISEYTKNIMYRNFPESEKINCKTVLLGLDESWFRTEPQNDIALKQNSSDDKLFKLVTVGRLDSRKGHDFIIEAINRTGLASNIVYNIIGKGDESYKSALLKLSAALQVKINILENLSDAEVKNQYRNSDLFVLAARTDARKVEGFGLVFLEAAACGLPSLATNVGAIPEVVTEDIGLIVPENLDSYAAAIRKIYEDVALIHSLRTTCIEKAASYSWGKTAEQTFL